MLSQKSKRIQSLESELPSIPEKLYFTIGEVSKLCDLKPHVLRYWEQEFPQLKPCKRRGNRRYYQRQDVILIRQITRLLYQQGYTIEGARAQLSNHHLFESLPQPQITDQSLLKVITELEAVVTALED